MSDKIWMGMSMRPDGLMTVVAQDGTIYRQTSSNGKYVPLNLSAKTKREYTDYTRDGKAVKATY